MFRWLTSGRMARRLDDRMARCPHGQKSRSPDGQKARYLDEYMAYIKYIKQIPNIGVASATPLMTWFFTPIIVWNFFIEFETVLNTFPLAQIEMLCLLPLTYSFCHWMLSKKNGFLKAITAAADLLFSGWPLLSDHFTIGAWGEILVLNWAPPPPHGRSIVLMPFNPLSRFGV